MQGNFVVLFVTFPAFPIFYNLHCFRAFRGGGGGDIIKLGWKKTRGLPKTGARSDLLLTADLKRLPTQLITTFLPRKTVEMGIDIKSEKTCGACGAEERLMRLWTVPPSQWPGRTEQSGKGPGISKRNNGPGH